jgi:long-chain fatty acid transport protein
MPRHLVLIALGAAMLGFARDANAQGFQVNEHGTCVMARGGTGVAKPCADGSAMFFNPAGIVGSRNGWTVSAGVTVISAYGGFTDDLTESTAELQNSPIPVPHLYVQYQKDRLAGGLGVFVPYGLGTKWEETFAGRSRATTTTCRTSTSSPRSPTAPTPWSPSVRASISSWAR